MELLDIETPFPRLTYDESMARFGTDKPDTRYGIELADLTETFRGSAFRAFARVVEEGGLVQAFSAPGAAGWSRSELDKLVEEAKARGAQGLVWLAFDRSDIRSPVGKLLSADELGAVAAKTRAADGDLVLIVADRPSRVHVALDGLRRLMADRLGLVPNDLWNFVWVTDMPLFEWSEEDQRWVAQHHPFTAPASEDLDPATAKARSYDITLNGYELASGSIRIHRPEVQRRMFELLGLSEDEIQEKFGHMIEAFRYGVPPHGGIAPGLDRIVMMLAGTDNIRDVIAFPKTSAGIEPLTGAPSVPSKEQLDALGIRLVEPPGGP